MASKLLRAVVLGPPGSGKGTVCERIAKSFGLHHLSSGQFLRENIRANSDVGILAKQYLEKGLLVPDHVFTRVMITELEKMQTQPWLLDGFPRTLGQAEALDTICELDLVISLNIPFESLKDRLSARWIHPASGRVYNMEFNPPQVHKQRNPTLILWDRDQQNMALCVFSGVQQNSSTPGQRSKLSISKTSKS
ncbi:adenylate kinase 4, mitochondrial [Podarcis lilfordi]|uniref:Adenylate kinase 4, mitochondrial n=1 Tax=Podarcis lilfordi TaxID=74358 RepID=A0AA35P649_9SAUR|nr:adenylate kinase 4, mitochondrial [Podarcis lilfordi]